MILGLVAAASLAGCDVTGTATIRADDYVDLDLRAVVDGNELCYWQFGETVRTEERRMSRGSQRLCLLQGTVHKEELRRWGVSVSHLGERIEVSFNPLGVVTTSRFTAASVGIDDLAVTVEFPGQVQKSTGIVEGNTVRFTDVDQLAEPMGLSAVGLDHAGPSWALVGTGALPDLQPEHAAPEHAAPEHAAPAPAAPVGPPGGPTPGSLLPPDLASGAHAPPGGSGWERPGTAPPDAQGNAPPPVHAKWAPPAS